MKATYAPSPFFSVNKDCRKARLTITPPSAPIAPANPIKAPERLLIMDRPARMPADVLRGFRIGVTSDRRSADLIAALERRGAQVLHAPALMIAPNDHDESLIIETRKLIPARPEVVLVTTG